MATLAIAALPVAQSVTTFIPFVGVTTLGTAGLSGASLLGLQAAGVLIDSFVTYPLLFPAANQVGPKLNDLQIQETAEGSPSNRPYGSGVRLAGVPVWLEPLREIENTASGSGKGGSGGDFITYQYVSSVVIRIAEHPTPISRVLKVQADGKDFWVAEPDIDVSSDEISVVPSTSYQNDGVTPFRHNAEFTSDENAGGPDLGKIKSGKMVVVSGFTSTADPNLLGGNMQVDANAPAGASSITISVAAVGKLYENDTIVIQNDTGVYALAGNYEFDGTLGTPDVRVIELKQTLQTSIVVGEVITPTSGATRLNGTWRVEATGNDASQGTSFMRVSVDHDPSPGTDNSLAGKDSGIDTAELFQELPLFSEKQAAAVRFYTGDKDQQPDSVVVDAEEDNLGVGNILGWRDRSLMVVEDLNYTDFGNRLPNFTFIIEKSGSTTTVAEVIGEIIEDAGIGPSEYDASGVTGDFLGFNVRGPQSPKVMLQPIFTAYQVVSYELGGKTFFIDRESVDELDVLTDDLSTHQPGELVPRKARISDIPRQRQINTLSVQYRDPEEDYQTGEAKSFRTNPVPGGAADSINLDLALGKDEAQQLADLLYAQSEASSRQVSIQLPPSYEGRVHEGMALTLSGVYGQDWRFLVTRVERGANNILHIEGIEDDLEVFEQSGTAESRGGPGGPGTQDGANAEAPFVAGFVLDLPPLKDEHRLTAGVYVAAANSDQGRAWRGAVVYRSTDGGTSYGVLATVVDQAVIGEVVSVTDNPFEFGVFDRANTVRVRVFNRGFELASVAEEEARRGHGVYMIGGEVVVAASAVLVSSDAATGEKVYDLSVLLRGQRDTEDAVETHIAGEPFVWLDGPGVQFVPMNLAAVGQVDRYKLVSPGGKLALAGSQEVTLAGKTLRPFRVVQVEGKRNSSDDLTISWERQTRMIAQGVEHGAALEEDFEAYRVEYLDGALVVRTVKVEDARSATYTASEQTSDGLTPGDPVTLRITQLSNRILEGRSRTVTL